MHDTGAMLQYVLLIAVFCLCFKYGDSKDKGPVEPYIFRDYLTAEAIEDKMLEIRAENAALIKQREDLKAELGLE